ncbi:hypothetical protein DM02DRAFT_410824 [Periconia macrospinosa]|uniref:Uncharacterized protein n=1 Tax=Periconia macrospinosa TaxID=97972 RepID=A0A2V1DS36_9PLEO|nr:hypothetical protein DM02DRAFT_410824 [Periconia macrospinosa]
MGYGRLHILRKCRSRGNWIRKMQTNQSQKVATNMRQSLQAQLPCLSDYPCLLFSFNSKRAASVLPRTASRKAAYVWAVYVLPCANKRKHMVTDSYYLPNAELQIRHPTTEKDRCMRPSHTRTRAQKQKQKQAHHHTARRLLLVAKSKSGPSLLLLGVAYCLRSFPPSSSSSFPRFPPTAPLPSLRSPN